jgi:hypothetical protein
MTPEVQQAESIKLSEAIIPVLMNTQLAVTIQEEKRQVRIDAMAKILAGCIAVSEDPQTCFNTAVTFIRAVLKENGIKIQQVKK